LLEPIFEPTFSNFSFGFRPGRNQHQAIEVIIQFRDDGYNFVVDADITGCFDNINHDLVIDLIAQRVADGNILDIVRQFLTAGVLDNGILQPVDSGTPQGGVISPLLANIVLHQLDLRLTQENLNFVRFADDFVIFCQNKQDAEQAMTFVSSILQNQLHLQLSPEKSSVTSFHLGFDFLGFHFYNKYITIRQKSLEKIKDNIRNKTIRSHNLDQNVILTLNRTISGFANYFATTFSNVKSQLLRLDQWTRKRIRCMKFNRISKFDNQRLHIKHLQKLGLKAFCDAVKQT
ncbi:reverse transcriptase domain-containing protein, partial [Anaerolineales bacterium HSG24]|nr:reverse transcriptase domain-containing protein [Anaerolineales bacterium HSG24]